MSRSQTTPQAATGSFNILRRCMALLRPYGRMTLGVYLAMLALTAITISVPQFIRWMIDRGIYGGDLALLGRAVLLLLGLTALKGVISYAQGSWTEIASQHVAYDLRNMLQSQLNRLSFSFHDQTESGQILSRAMQDVERIRFLTGRAVLRLVESLVLLVGTAVVLVWMNPLLGLLTIALLPLLIWRAYAFGARYRPISLRLQRQLGTLTTQVEQNLRGAQVVKGFAQEEAEIARFTAQNERWFGLSRQAATIEAFNAPLLDLLANLGSVAILWVGGVLVARQQLTLGELVAFTTYLGQLLRPVSLSGRIVPILAIAAAAGERIFEILDAVPDVQDRAGARPAGELAGAIRFEQVSFGYDDQRKVLRDIDFAVAPGQVVALVGATGSGKSTIINLLARFYDPSAGRITIDGIDTRDYTLRSLRAQIGIVLQESWLFGATVRDNIAFGQPDAAIDTIEAAARDAQAHTFISQLPNGYDTRVGERGATLSGGQKQRVAIARALLADPRILILDDATSSVDADTEQQIQRALERLMAGRTTIVIAHRLSTVRKADLILLLDGGRIVARGTHRQLLAESPAYADLVARQLRPDALTLAPHSNGHSQPTDREQEVLP